MGLVGWTVRPRRPEQAANLGGPIETVEILHSKGTTNFDLVTGAATAINDMLIVMQVLSLVTITTSDCVAPTGTAGTWTQATVVGGTQLAGKAWWRPVTVGGAQTITLTGSGAAVNFGWAYVLRGTNLTAPIEGSGNNAGSATATHAAPGLTSAVNNGLLIGAWATKA